MPTPVVMPQLGESVVEGTVSRWLKREGESVTAYEPLLEISTDKVETEIPSPASGVLLRILVAEGATAQRGTALALIGAPGESAPTPAPSAAAGQPAQPHPHGPHITPVVARMAAEHGLDLSAIAGTGTDGRVTRKDVEAFLAQRAPAPPAPEELPPWERPGSGELFRPTVEYERPPAPPPAAAPAPPPPTRLHPPEHAPHAAEGELIALTAMRRAIAEHMRRSMDTAAHATTVFEVDMAAVLTHQHAHKEDFAAQGVNLTLTAYFAAAAIHALHAVPVLNSEWREDGIFHWTNVHLGVAVGVGDGLVVPVIHQAQERSLIGLAHAINDLSERARHRQLAAEELRGGTFTLSNHGVGGSLLGLPIIHQPQSGILGVGLLEKRVRVVTDAAGQDMIAIRPCCYVTLTFDHRVADGEQADAFLLAFKRRLESWGAD
jgi:2-oxoisovalerate dehydrogenase E2 component (dihydrolipoyl transacylase)